MFKRPMTPPAPSSEELDALQTLIDLRRGQLKAQQRERRMAALWVAVAAVVLLLVVLG